MAAIHSTSTYFQAASKVLRRVFIKTAKEVPVLYSHIFNIEQNDTKRPFMTVLPIVGLGTLALKPEGAGPAFDQSFEGTATTFNFLTYALAYKITEEAELEDAQNLLSRLPRMLAYGEQITKELLYWNVLNFAFTAGVNGADGVTLANAAHPLAGNPGITFSNTAGSTALTPESLQNAFINFQTLVDDRNLPIYRTPRYLVVPPQLHKVAEEVLGSPYYPYSSENKVNVVEGKLQLLVSRYLTLTSPPAWYVLSGVGDIEDDTNSLVVSYKWQNKQVTWMDGATGNMSHRTSFRATWGWVDWRGVYGSQGA